MYYPLMSHTTHLNSLLWNKSTSEIYATFFHQGAVFAIQSSGENRRVVDGLKSPHSLTRLANESFMVTDSRNNPVLICHKDKTSKIVNLPDCNWIQDAKLNASNTLFVCDANNCRILETSLEGEIVDSWHYDEN